jgi:hypothetical protein
MNVKEHCKSCSFGQAARFTMQIRIIVGFMILGFAGTLLCHWREMAGWWSHGAPRALSAAPAAPLRALAPPRSWRGSSLSVSPPPRADGRPPITESPAAPPIEVPPPGGYDSPPLPVLFAIRQDGDPELDVVNTSDEPLTITVLVADAAKAQLFMPPRAEQHLGTDSGLDFEPGSNVTLRSAGYQELTQTVR